MPQDVLIDRFQTKDMKVIEKRSIGVIRESLYLTNRKERCIVCTFDYLGVKRRKENQKSSLYVDLLRNNFLQKKKLQGIYFHKRRKLLFTRKTQITLVNQFIMENVTKLIQINLRPKIFMKKKARQHLRQIYNSK